MFQRLIILKKWEDAGLKKSRKKKVRDFIKFVEENPQLAWEACAREFHKKYSDVFDDLIPPLMETGDNLIILNLLRFLDPNKKRKELNLLKRFVTKADPQNLQPSLEAIAKLKIPSLTKDLKQREDLPARVRAILLEPKNSVA